MQINSIYQYIPNKSTVPLIGMFNSLCLSCKVNNIKNSTTLFMVVKTWLCVEFRKWTINHYIAKLAMCIKNLILSLNSKNGES